jgi:hypothetical protein
MALAINNAVVTVDVGGNAIQTTNAVVPTNAKWFVCVTDIDNSNTAANNTEVNLKTFNSVDMGTAVARIANDASGTGQLKNAYAVVNPSIGTFPVATRHVTTRHYSEQFSITSDNPGAMTVSPVSFGTGTSASITVNTEVGDLVVYSVSLNNSDPTAITASSTPPNNLQTLVQSGGAASTAGTRIFTKTATGSTTSAAWSFSSSQRWSVIAFVFHEDTAAVTSINGGNPVTVGQSNVVIAHTGFTGAVTSVTTNRAGVTATIVSGDASSTTINLSGWTEGAQYPVAPINVTYTLTRGAESASGTQSLIRPANYAQVTFVGAITDDVNQIGYGLAQAGHVVEGGAFYYRTDQVPTLTVNADTSWTSDPAGGTFDAVFIPVSGATSGRAYLFDITLLNGEIVSIVGGLTSVGATSIGLTSSGLTSVGL